MGAATSEDEAHCVTVQKTVRDSNQIVFDEELNRLGYVEGKNLIIDRFSAEGKADRYDDLVHEVVSTNPDLILSIGAPLTVRSKQLRIQFRF